MSRNKNKVNKEKIIQLRHILGLRRTEFAAKINYTYRQLVRVEDGTVPINDALVRKLCRVFGVSEEWLSDDGDAGAEWREWQEKDIIEQRRQRLRIAYEESGLSQREFAKRTHSSRSMMNDILSGKNPMTVRYAQKIEDALGIGEDWLMYGNEDAKEYPCGEAMIRYLKDHPKLRMEIWEEMQKEP